MNMQLLLGAWLLVLAAFTALSIVRWRMGRSEDDHLHFNDSERQLVTAQVSTAHKLDVLDRWKTALLVLTVIAGLCILALHAYSVWQTNSRFIMD